MAYPKVISGKNMQLYVLNPASAGGFTSISVGPSGAFVSLNIDNFETTEKVDSSKYASSWTSGYMRNTTGIYEGDGSFDVLLDATGSLSGSAGGAIGMKIDDWIDFALLVGVASGSAPTNTTGIAGAAQTVGTFHVNQVGKPIATTDGKIKIKVSFSYEGQWFTN